VNVKLCNSDCQCDDCYCVVTIYNNIIFNFRSMYVYIYRDLFIMKYNIIDVRHGPEECADASKSVLVNNIVLFYNFNFEI
jgi:hypothetical protein